MPDDIIQPSGRAGDAQLVESYAQRQGQKASLATERKRSSRCKGNDPEMIRRFRELYVRGATYKRITLNLGLSNRVINRMRRELDLPKRRADPGDDGARTGDWVTFSFDLPEDLYRRMNAHVSTRYRSRAHYMRALLKRDLEG